MNPPWSQFDEMEMLRKTSFFDLTLQLSILKDDS